MTAEEIARLRAQHEAAGEWYAVTEKGTVDICTRKPRRLAVVALMVSPEDAECIIAEHEAVPDLCDEVERLREIVKPLADYYEHELKHLHPEPGEDPTTFDTAWINCFEHSCCIFRLAAAALGVK
jgi:hypothetical protein